VGVSDEANPQRVGGYDTSSLAGLVAVSGSYAYMMTNTRLQIIDLSDPANPQQVGGYDISIWQEWEWATVAVSGNYVYWAGFVTGLHILDVSNPANPQRVGGYDTL
jgi:hypothetical protein